MGAIPISAAAASALLAAAALRLPLVSSLLAAYLALVANVGVVTLALSPVHDVTRTGLIIVELVLLVAAAVAWQLRGRPLPDAAAWARLRHLGLDPVLVIALAFLAALLAYELVLGLTVPPNNTDALAYHLPKAVAWAQHGGLYWIPNAPTVRLNAFQPLAEQQILFLVAATGSGALANLPQLLAELAILVAIYGCARRLGYGARASTCAAFLFATFSLVALEASTAQNDLVMAAFPAAAACLLLGGGRLEPVLGGVAIGFGLGAKLTVALVLPVLAALALARGRRTLVFACAGAAAGFFALGMWGYVLNAAHTGHVLGVNTGIEEDRAPPSYPGSVQNGFYLLYGLMDVSVLSNRLVDGLAIAGAVVAAGSVLALRRGGLGRALDAAGAAVPFLAPLLVIGGAAALAGVASAAGFPIRGTNTETERLGNELGRAYGHVSNESYSAFGPLAVPALLVAGGLTVWAAVRRRGGASQLVLASALPLFLVVLAAATRFGPWLERFFLAPLVLAAPLLAALFRSRLATAAYLGVAALVVFLTVTKAQTKPLDNPYGFGHPWELTREQALVTNSRTDYARALAAYERLVPPGGCVGAVLGDQEPSYLLYGPSFRRHVVFLPSLDTVNAALQKGLFYVVISTGRNRVVAARFRRAGWRIRPLGTYWLLASTGAGPAPC